MLIKLFDEWTLVWATEDNQVEVHLPFIDVHRDELTLYVRQAANGEYIVTDGGLIVSNLEFDGLQVAEGTRLHRVVISLLEGTSLNLKGGEIYGSGPLHKLPSIIWELVRVFMYVQGARAMYEIVRRKGGDKHGN
ncbi:MAG: DUF1828 domain-containing protein [Deltaproteobacteria bacterium]|nr:DUF1828 domain-containing protein [Deltaproteobacteria bacterium]